MGEEVTGKPRRRGPLARRAGLRDDESLTVVALPGG